MELIRSHFRTVIWTGNTSACNDSGPGKANQNFQHNFTWSRCSKVATFGPSGLILERSGGKAYVKGARLGRTTGKLQMVRGQSIAVEPGSGELLT